MRVQNRCTKVVLLTLRPAGSFGLQGHSCRWTVADELFTESPDSHFGHSRVAVVVRQSPDYQVILVERNNLESHFTGSGDPALIRGNCGCAAFRTRLFSRPCVTTLGTLRTAGRKVRIHSSPHARDAIMSSVSQSLIWSMETVSTVTSFGIWIRTAQ
jgi:hypothetical protein